MYKIPKMFRSQNKTMHLATRLKFNTNKLPRYERVVATSQAVEKVEIIVVQRWRSFFTQINRLIPVNKIEICKKPV